jgi:hypothetical protein
MEDGGDMFNVKANMLMNAGGPAFSMPILRTHAA